MYTIADHFLDKITQLFYCCVETIVIAFGHVLAISK